MIPKWCSNKAMKANAIDPNIATAATEASIRMNSITFRNFLPPGVRSQSRADAAISRYWA